MYPMAPSPPCHHMDEPHPLDELWENSEALYTTIFKHQRELKRKQQREFVAMSSNFVAHYACSSMKMSLLCTMKTSHCSL
ncbi:unnamed protein product [Brassica oleracea]